jgi:hypothetical protein
MTHTFTRTHVYVTFANPYLACRRCTSWVTSYHSPDRCGCDAGWWNMPCEHDAGVFSACPSWGPVDGCSCQEHLGEVLHEEPPAVAS